MRTRQQCLALRVARGFLLVIVAMGVYGMHTLGHLDGQHGGQIVGVHHSAEALTAPPPWHDGFAPSRDMPGLDPTSVCLAVLASVLAVAAMAAWIRLRRQVGNGESSVPAYQVARPPPELVSLRLARLSVLRI
ncbi:hypothetical protein [Nonomuraea glycinis]|uniref:hypothetical protein n=1 Tax=Nonomuraea glycinis TaxID=2047744 RepID=UPI0033A53F92